MTGKEVVEVAKSQGADVGGEHVLSTGVRVRVNAVSAQLLMASTARIEIPPIPMWYDEARDKEVPNPSDPGYLLKLEERDTKQTNVTLDALAMFGIDLVDGMPKNDIWLKKLKLMERLGDVDLSPFDLDDEIDLEFVYKKFVAISGGDIELLRKASGLVTEEDLAEAENSFPDNETSGADS